MRTLYGITMTLVLCLVAQPVKADDEASKKKLVGVWLLAKETDGVPKGTPVEFTADGKVNIKLEIGDQKVTLDGVYTLKDGKLTVKMKRPGDGKENEDTDTIEELTDSKLVLKDKDGKKTEFDKKK